MLEAKKYRQYAKDCVRIAASMSGKDRQTLLDIADAWEARAVEAESKGPKSDGGRDPRVRSLPIDAIRDTLSDLPSKLSNIKQALISQANKPFFVWMNTTRMHAITHVRASMRGQSGMPDNEYGDGMVEHDARLFARQRWRVS